MQLLNKVSPHPPWVFPTSLTKWMLCILKTDKEILFFSNTLKLETWTKVICCISSRPASITRRWQFPVPPKSWDWMKMATMGTYRLSPLRNSNPHENILPEIFHTQTCLFSSGNTEVESIVHTIKFTFTTGAGFGFEFGNQGLGSTYHFGSSEKK